MKRSRAVAGVLTFALCFSFAPPALAASGSGVTITKTDVPAENVVNYYGCAVLENNTSSENQQIAIIDKDGNYVFPYKTSDLRYINDGGIISKIANDPYTTFFEDPGFYKLDGEPAFTGDYFGATCMKDGYAFVTECDENYENIKCCLINDKGDVVYEFKDEFVEKIDQGGNESAAGFITRSIGRCFSEGLLLCHTFSHWNSTRDYKIGSTFYVDTEGNTALYFPSSKYLTADYFQSGLAAVQSAANEKWGYIDKSGNEVIPCEYDQAELFWEGLAPVKKNGKWGYINMKNEVVIPFEYDIVYGAGDGLAEVCKDGRHGLVDYSNNIVLPLEYDDVSLYDEGVAYAIKDGCIYTITGYTASDTAQESSNGSSGNNSSSSGNTSDLTVNVNGRDVVWTDAVPFIDSNWRTMVPLRAVGDALGLAVSWDNKAREAVFTDGSKTIYFPIGSSTARTSEGTTVTMNTAAVIVGDRTYAPVRYLAEYFGYSVDWDNANKTVNIGGKSATTEPSTGYTDEELIAMATAYYKAKNGTTPPIVEIDSRDGNSVTIHLYEEVADEGGNSHTATMEWYTVDNTTGKGSSMFSGDIDLAA